ncbi:MAG: phosphomannomutase/phosphoglucomutase, partial [Gammaproteobacteria bacterium]|nr:phosphomannomutase/phosphoglucomutase [Gammaproteobacteria bacterium]
RAAGEKSVAVGRDGRLSGPSLSEALMRGLVAAGIEVIDVGAVTTPMLYFAAYTLCTSGIQVTGSHNPKDYNGFKMVLAGRAIYGDEIQNLRKVMEAGSAKLEAGGSIRKVDVTEAYTKRIVGDIKLARPLRIVVDSGNGIAGASAPGILRAIGCEVTELFSEVDGDFPNHHPDPSKPENLKDLIAALQKGDAELGLAFDGDGDRLGIVTKDGQNIYPDRQMMLFAQDVLSRVPGGTIVYDVKCSQRLGPAIEAAGGKPLIYKTGHSLIKAKMKEIDSPLGGEMSGHIFFKERWFGFDDGTYAGCRLLEILSKSPNASDVLNALPTSFSTPELNVKCAEGEPHTLVEQLVKTARFDAPAKVSTIDGVRVDWPDGFGLIRASNTTPVLVMRFEGQTQEVLERIQRDMLALLKSVKPDATLAEASH